MADSKVDDAEKAYAAAAAEVKPAKAAEPAPAATPKAEHAEADAAKPVPAKARAKVIEKKKPAPTKRAAAKPKPAVAPVKAKITRKPAAPAVRAAATAKPVPTLNQLKEKIMDKTVTNPMADAFGEYQNRAKTVYDKGTVALTEMTDFAKGNVEAMVESGKIFAAGVQDLGKSYVEEAKTAYETATADVKELAAIKSPTELFQLQGKIARRNFDAMVATSSKNTDAFIKLATEAFAPLSGRVNLAAEKLSNVA